MNELRAKAARQATLFKISRSEKKSCLAHNTHTETKMENYLSKSNKKKIEPSCAMEQ